MIVMRLVRTAYLYTCDLSFAVDSGLTMVKGLHENIPKATSSTIRTAH